MLVRRVDRVQSLAMGALMQAAGAGVGGSSALSFCAVAAEVSQSRQCLPQLRCVVWNAICGCIANERCPIAGAGDVYCPCFTW